MNKSAMTIRINQWSNETVNRERFYDVAKAYSCVALTVEFNRAFEKRSFPSQKVIFLEATLDQDPVAYWVVFERRFVFLRALIAYCAPCILRPDLKKEVWTGLLDFIASKRPVIFRMLDHGFLRFADAELLNAIQMTSEEWGRLRVEKFGTHILDLTLSMDELWKGVHCNHRASIRGAIRRGVTVRKVIEPSVVNQIYKLSRETFGRSGTRGPSYRFLKSLYDFLCVQGLCEIYLAEDAQGAAVGAYMVTKLNGYAILVCAFVGNTAPPGTGNLLQWEIIKDLKAHGLTHYDLGGVSISPAPGSKAAGIRMFKERFGGRLCELYGIEIVFHRWFYLVIASLNWLSYFRPLTALRYIGQWLKARLSQFWLKESQDTGGQIMPQDSIDVQPLGKPEMENRNLIIDEETLKSLVQIIISDHPRAATDLRNGDRRALNFLVGEALRRSQGRADPRKTSEVLRKILGVE